ncbi:MAG: tetratricopeptide repeat protein, partial [Candidatus Brocadiae bacterium]|nr:tetratricopeptide repeat protein [Candidatus Brocadiia bacterium]
PAGEAAKAPEAPRGADLGAERAAADMMLAGDFDAAMREYERLIAAHAADPIADYYWQRFMEAADDANDDVTEEIVRATDRLLATPLHPVAEAHARQYRLLVARGKSKFADAEREAAALGFVRDWLLCGPFENASENGLKAVYGPEKSLNLAEIHEGLHGRNAWFQSAARATFGTVDLQDLFRQNSDVCAYALAFVNSETTRPVAIRLGSDGAAKVWVNGQLALTADAYRPPGFDQDAAAATLEKGWNAVLVKLCQKGGNEDTGGLIDTTWEFSLRLTEPSGKVLDGWAVAGTLAEARGLALSERSGAAEVPVDRGAEGWLLERVKADPEDAVSRARLAYLKLKRHALDENDRGARDLLGVATRLAPGEATFWLWLAEAEDAKNRKLAALARARELAKDSALLEWTEGLEHAGHIDDRAMGHFRRALELRPRMVLARTEIAGIYARRGGPWMIEARKIYEEIIREYPDHGIAKATLARMMDATPGKQTQFFEDRIASWGLDQGVRSALISIYRRTGEFDRAVALCDARLAQQPFDIEAHLTAGEIFESRGMWDEALQRYARALETAPENLAAILASANACVGAGRSEEAAAWLSRALSVRTNLADVEKRLRSLRPKEKEFWRGYEADLAPWIEKAKNAKREGVEAATYVYKGDVVLVNENGTANYYTQQVIKLHDETAAREFQRISALGGNFDTFTGGRAEFKTARRILADGTEVEGQRREGSWFAGFPNARAGDILVIEFQMQETGEPRYKGYFGLMLPLQPEFHPVTATRITLVHPASKPIFHEAVRCDVKPAVSTHDGRVVTVWEATGLPQVTEEPNMPAAFEVLPYLHFSTFRTWEDVGVWFSGLVRDRFEASAEIRDAVKEAVKGATTKQEKIEALYQLMVARTRYEALSLENHAYLPFKASETFERKYGDCKDTATLFVTMMREAGEEANLVLVRTNDQGVIHTDLPSMKVFNHCIAWVPDAGGGRGMFIDGTARYYAAKDLPSMDQGAVVFIVRSDANAAAQVTEWLPAEMNARDSSILVRVKRDGSATIVQKSIITGMDAGMIRQRFQEGADRKKEFEKWYSRVFEGIQVDSITFSDLGDYNKPVEMTAEYTVPRFARKDGRNLVIRPSLFPAQLLEEYGASAERMHDLLLEFPRTRRDRIVFELPEGWKAGPIPQGVEKDNPLGAFTWKAKASPGKVEVESEMTIKGARVPKGDYRAFRDFASEVDRVQDEEIVIEPK